MGTNQELRMEYCPMPGINPLVAGLWESLGLEEGPKGQLGVWITWCSGEIPTNVEVFKQL